MDVLQERAGVTPSTSPPTPTTPAHRRAGARLALPDHGAQEHDDFVGGFAPRAPPVLPPPSCSRRTSPLERHRHRLAGGHPPECGRRGVAVLRLGGGALRDAPAWGAAPAAAGRLRAPHGHALLRQTTGLDAGAAGGLRQERGGRGDVGLRAPPGALRGHGAGGAPYCFCAHCLANGRRAEARRRPAPGPASSSSTPSWRRPAGARPQDGHHVAFWRVLLRSPELLQWERLWFEQQQALHQEIYGTVKTADPRKTVGWHVLAPVSFSPVLRARWDYARC